MTMHGEFSRLLSALHKGRLEAPMTVHVVGLCGTEGAALTRLLLSRLPGLRLVGHDFAEELEISFGRAHVALPKAERQERLASLLALPGLTVRKGSKYLAGIKGAEVIFAGQNWRAYAPNHPILDEAAEETPFAQMMDLYVALAPCPSIGITGTNGKTTTSNWLQAMASGIGPALVSGNDLLSRQALDGIFELPTEARLILEISNRQARDLRRAPKVVGVTSLAPDHVAEHGGYQAYLAAKRRLVEEQPFGGTAVLNHDDAEVRRFAWSARCRILWASAKPLPLGLNGAYADPQGELWLRRGGVERSIGHRNQLPLPGEHNLCNGLIALLCGLASGLDLDGLRPGLFSFQGVRNRLQRLLELDGITWFNDLASTTPWATLAGLKALGPGAVVIVGAKLKAPAGFVELARALETGGHPVVFMPGPVSERLKSALSPRHPSAEASTIQQAISAAKSLAGVGGRVVLSPAGAGFFSTFLEGKSSFNRAIRRSRVRRSA